MKNKFRNYILILILIFMKHNYIHAESIWKTSPAGKCFTSIDDFFVSNYGPDYAADENIQLTALTAEERSEKLKNKKPLLWAFDETPRVNTSWTLLEISKDGRACAVLHAPVSTSISFKLKPNGDLPSTVMSLDTTTPDISATRIIYRLDRKSRTYRPDKCSRVPEHGREKLISCDHAFKD